MRCIPAKQALTIQWAPNLVVLHLCTCRASVMQPLSSTHSLLTFIYSFVFSLACSHRCHFHVMKGGWGCVDTTLGLTSMLRWQMGKALCTSKKRGHSRTFSLWIEALLGDVSRRGGLLFHEKGWNQHFTLFSQSKTPVCMTGKRQEHCSLQQK